MSNLNLNIDLSSIISGIAEIEFLTREQVRKEEEVEKAWRAFRGLDKRGQRELALNNISAIEAEMKKLRLKAERIDRAIKALPRPPIVRKAEEAEAEVKSLHVSAETEAREAKRAMHAGMAKLAAQKAARARALVARIEEAAKRAADLRKRADEALRNWPERDTLLAKKEIILAKRQELARISDSLEAKVSREYLEVRVRKILDRLADMSERLGYEPEALMKAADLYTENRHKEAMEALKEARKYLQWASEQAKTEAFKRHEARKKANKKAAKRAKKARRVVNQALAAAKAADQVDRKKAKRQAKALRFSK